MTDADAVYAAVRSRLSARPLVLLLDVDGTLSPIVPRPEDAGVPDATRRLLHQLAAAPSVHVALVSGRAARDAKRLVGVDGLWGVGNHGFEISRPDGELVHDPEVAPMRERIATAASAASALVDANPGTQLEDKAWTLSVHYRRAGEGAEQALRAGLERIAAEHDLELTAGRKVFELRPPLRINKGTASVALADQLLGDAGGAVLYAGDDRTDEDAFRALRQARPEAVTIRIASDTGEAPTETAAEFVLSDVDAMRAFLELLAADVRTR